MRGGQERHAVAADVRVVGRGTVQHVRRVDFLGLLERVLQAQVRRGELRLIEIVGDGLAGDRVAQTNLERLVVEDEPLAGVVVHGGRAALELQLRQADVPHFGGALDAHLRRSALQVFRPLARDHLVFAFDTTKARAGQVVKGRYIDCHWSVPLKCRLCQRHVRSCSVSRWPSCKRPLARRSHPEGRRCCRGP